MSRFILSAFADEISTQLDCQMDVLEELNIHYIELRGIDGKNVADYTLDEIDGVFARMQARGFQTSAVGSPIGKVDIREPFEEHLEKFKHVLALAQRLHAPYIRLFSFFIPEGEQPYDYREEVLRRMQLMADAANGSGVALLHENERYIYGDVPERCAEILQHVQGDNLFATYDPANFVHCHVQNYPHAYEMMRPYVRYLHMKDAVYEENAARTLDMGFQNIGDVHRAPGEGEGQIAQVLRAFWESGYEGFLTLEPHLSADPAVDGPEQFKRAYGALMKVLDQIGAKAG